MYRKLARFTASGTFTLPATASPAVEYIASGGGGGGGGTLGNNGTAIGSGGGGGEHLRGVVNLIPGDSYQLIVGAAGLGAVGGTVTTLPIPPTAGGDTSVVGLFTAHGGMPGVTTGIQINVIGGDSGAGGLPGAVDTFAAVAPQSHGGGAGPIASAPTFMPAATTSGVCVGGQAGRGIDVPLPAPPRGAGAGGFGDGDSGTNNGGHATGVGCGGGGAGKKSGSTQWDGGNGFRGQIDLIYWDTEQ